MSLFLDDGDVRLYQGDALEQLRLLPDGCVDMVATSPPFYGLRDYGTGEWEGGDESCDHSAGRGGHLANSAASIRGGGHAMAEGQTVPMKQTCGKCGARRVDRQIGLEETPDQWVTSLVAVFRECRRVLADHGTLWVEIGDSYTNGPAGGTAGQWNGSSPLGTNKRLENFADASKQTKRIPGTKPKDLLGQPWLLAFALRADGWYLRSEIIWARPNPMPESVTDRPTKSHSTVFLLSKRPRYFYDADAIREASIGRETFGNSGHKVTLNGDRQDGDRRDMTPNEGANARSVWTIPTEPTPFAHFATWPQKLVARMIQAGTSERGKCPECGKPWVRDVERPENIHPGSSHTHERDLEQGGTQTHASGKPTGTIMRERHQAGRAVRTVGWSPSCGCGPTGSGNPPWPDVKPCTVLDPFAGSGTTLLVARNHQRHAIGIELNPDYCRIAAQRLSQLSLLT